MSGELLAALVLGALAAGAVLAWPGRHVPGPDGRERGAHGPEVPRRGGAVDHRPAGRAAATRSLWVFRAPTSRRRPRGPLEVHLLDALAAALEAGMPTDRALCLALDSAAAVDRLPADWAELRRAAELGLPLAPSWARVARRTGSTTAASAGRAWAVATASGAPLAAAVRSAAQAARERHRLLRVVETTTAGARATVAVLTLLPVAGVGLASLLGVDPLRLYATPAALASAVLGLVLLAVGHVVVRAMVARVVGGAA